MNSIDFFVLFTIFSVSVFSLLVWAGRDRVEEKRFKDWIEFQEYLERKHQKNRN